MDLRAHAPGAACDTVRTRNNARQHAGRGVDREHLQSACRGDESRAAGTGTDVEQAVTGVQLEVVERTSRKGIRERLEYFFVHRNVIVPALGLLVLLQVHR
jgi:hypothetical protein